MVLLLPLPQHEQPPVDRLLARDPRLRIATAADCSRRRRPTARAAAPPPFDGASPTRATRSTIAHPRRRRTPPRQLGRRHIVEHREHIVDRQASVMSSPNSSADALLGTRRLLGAVHERRHLARQRALRLALLRRAPRALARARRSSSRAEKREELQIRHRRRDRRCSARTGRSGTATCAPDRARSCPLRSCRTSRRSPSSAAASPDRAPSPPRSLRIRSMPAVMLPH